MFIKVHLGTVTLTTTENENRCSYCLNNVSERRKRLKFLTPLSLIP